MLYVNLNHNKACAFIALLACCGTASRAQDVFPALPEWATGKYEVVTALNSDGTTYAFIVKDPENRSFLCHLYSSKSFAGIQELGDCEPIVAREEAKLQSERNLKIISDFILDRIPGDKCGEDISSLYEMAFVRFGGERFQSEFGRWDESLNNSLIRRAIEAIDGIIVIESRFKDNRFWIDGRIIRSDNKELDSISFVHEGQRVLFEDACR